MLKENANYHFKEVIRGLQDSMLRQAVDIKIDFGATEPDHLGIDHLFDSRADSNYTWAGHRAKFRPVVGCRLP